MLCFFQATDSEELTITEGEELEILERDGEGWCKVTNQRTLNSDEVCSVWNILNISLRMVLDQI